MPKTPMTQNWVHKITTDQAQEDWYDEKEKGLVLRVSRTGRKVWYLFYRDPMTKENCRYRIGEYSPTLTLADARDLADAKKVEIRRGANPVAERRALKEAPTVSELAADYLERWAKPRKRSWAEDARVIEHDLKPWKNRKARDITRKDAAKLLDDIVKRGAPVQANRTLALIRRIFNWAIEEGILEVNPCHRMKPRALEKASERALSDDELKKVWAAIEQLPSTEPEHQATAETARDILKLMLLTAQRGGEVKSMAWRDVDLEAGWWSIPSSSAKNSRSHRVPLSAPALAILTERKAQADAKLATRKASGEEAKPTVWVFPGRGAENEGHVTEIKKAVANARRMSNCEWTPHDLRRTASTGMGKLNILPSTISRVLNHKDVDVPDVTWVYLQYQYDAEKRKALDAWAERLMLLIDSQAGERLQAR